MPGSRIYADFHPEIQWIRKRIAADVRSLSPGLRPLARYYTGQRLKILPGGSGFILTDPRMGRPVPYAAFWLADAFDMNNPGLAREAGVGMVYSALATTLRDDNADSVPGDTEERESLARFWEGKYLEALGDLLPNEEDYIEVTAWAKDEWGRYNRWRTSSLGGGRNKPFSNEYLRESSRYFVATVFPTLMAIAFVAKKEEKLPEVRRFLEEFSMGWRIFDDLMDWERDLGANEMNRSSVLMYVKARMGLKKPVDRLAVWSCMMNETFVNDAYGAMIDHFRRAKMAIDDLDADYLVDFLDQLIGFQLDKKDSLLSAGNLTLAELNVRLAEVLGPGWSPQGRAARGSRTLRA